jgi:hypothetical protein
MRSMGTIFDESIWNVIPSCDVVPGDYIYGARAMVISVDMLISETNHVYGVNVTMLSSKSGHTLSLTLYCDMTTLVLSRDL